MVDLVVIRRAANAMKVPDGKKTIGLLLLAPFLSLPLLLTRFDSSRVDSSVLESQSHSARLWGRRLWGLRQKWMATG